VSLLANLSRDFLSGTTCPELVVAAAGELAVVTCPLFSGLYVYDYVTYGYVLRDFGSSDVGFNCR